MFRAILGGLGVVVGVLCLLSLAARGQLLTNPLRWDFQNGPGLGTFVLIVGLLDLRRALRERRSRRHRASGPAPGAR